MLTRQQIKKKIYDINGNVTKLNVLEKENSSWKTELKKERKKNDCQAKKENREKKKRFKIPKWKGPWFKRV